jgi:hypothetical protein
MTDSKTTVYTAKFDVKSAISSLSRLQRKIADIDQKAKVMLQGAQPAMEKLASGLQRLRIPKESFAGITEALNRTTARALSMRREIEQAYQRPLKTSTAKVSTKGSELVQRMLLEEKAAREKLNSAINTYRRSVKASEKEAAKAAKATASAISKATKEAEKLAKASQRAQQKLKSMILGIGKSSNFASSGLGRMMSQVFALTASYVGLHRAIIAVGKAKDDFLRFDEITTAALTIAKPNDDAFRYGAEGAKQFREAVRDAANEVKVSAGAMADSALFWVKAGQKNLDSVKELSKVGVLFSRANRDASNNILDFARGNDVLSDMITLFRKDMSTPERAMESAQTLGEQITAAANSSNVVAEQLFEYSKKVGALFKAGEVRDEDILAIAASLASAGLKQDSGVHVRRILTQLANSGVQKMLKDVGIEVADKKSGEIRSFGDIFGELQKVLETQKPLERMSFLKELFGQRAVSTAAALAGLNENAQGETSIATILEQIQNSKGVMSRNQEEQLKTLSGRIGALADRITNALGKMFEESTIIGDVVSGLENNLPRIIQWIQDFGATLKDVVIPGVQMAWEQISEWLSPAISVLSSLFGDAGTSAEDLADTITTLVKLWIKWKLVVLAMRGLRLIDWFVQLASTVKKAAASTALLGTATKTSVTTASASVSKLPGVFSAVGVGIAAAIIGWEIGSLIQKYVIEPLDLAERRTKNFVSKYGENYEKLEVGKEDTKSLQAEVKKVKSDKGNVEHAAAYGGLAEGYGYTEADTIGDNDRKMLEERRRKLEEVLRNQQLQEARQRKDVRNDQEMLSGARTTQEDIQAVTWRRQVGYSEAKKTAKGSPRDQEATNALVEATDRYKDVVSGAIRALNDDKQSLKDRYDAIADQLETATGEEKEAMKKTLDEFRDGITSVSNAIDQYTQQLSDIDKKNNATERQKVSAEMQKKRYKGGFRRGGKSKEIDPYATPLLTSLDREGNRRIHIGMKQGNAATVFRESPQMRELLKRSLEKKPSISSISFGDNNITITAKSDAKPEDIARVLNREMRRIGKQNTHEIQRVIGNIAPSQI